MNENARRAIAAYSQQIDGLEVTRDLIKTSNVLCFTTIDRTPEETVSIEFTNTDPDDRAAQTNAIINAARDGMVKYIEERITDLNEKIDKIFTEKD